MNARGLCFPRSQNRDLGRPAFHKELALPSHEAKKFFNKDRLSYWFFAAFIVWVGYFLFLGIPIFYFVFSASFLKVASFCGLACALQMMFAPWMFDARATPERPKGKVGQRIIVMSVWLTLTLLLFMLFLNYHPGMDDGQKQGIILADAATALVLGLSIFVIFKFSVKYKS